MTHNKEKRAFLDWLALPPKERKPKTRKELAERLNIATMTLHRWEREAEQEAQLLSDENEYDSIDYFRSNIKTADIALLKACVGGNAAAQKVLRQLLGQLIEKPEGAKFELSADDHFRIRQEARRRLSEISGGADRDRGLLPEQPLLPQEIWQGKRQD